MSRAPKGRMEDLFKNNRRVFAGEVVKRLRTYDEGKEVVAGITAVGTPAAVVQKLNTALREIIDSPDVQARFKNVGFEGFSSTPEGLAAFIKVQLGVWEKMVKDADIKPN
jgi:tripartite-type tricarboxylate transporter receptor subunit TctC